MTEIIDCRYCANCMCESPDGKWAQCFADGGGFDHNIKDPKKEAQECVFFSYCDAFPKN